MQARHLFPAVVLFLINVLNFYDRNAPGALVEPMRKEFHLSDTQIGLLGGVFIWVYALVGVPLGRIADRWSRKKLLALGIVAWTSLTATAGIASTFSILLFSRMGVGVGEAVCAPAATSWLGDLFPAARRSRILALFMLGVPVGGALSYFFSGTVAQAYGWLTAMVVAALPGVLLVPLLLLLHEPIRGASDGNSTANASSRGLLSVPTFWWIVASGVFVNFNMYAIGTFLPAFLSRVHKLPLGRSGIATGVVYLVGGVSGALLSGYLGDRIVHARRDGRMRIAALLTAIGTPFALVGVMQPPGSLALALVCLTVGYGSLNAYYGLVYSSIQDIVPAERRGFAMSLYFMAMYLCGASFGPLLTGNLSDRLAKHAMLLSNGAHMTEAFKAIGLQQAMMIIPLLSLLLGAVLYLGSRTIARDLVYSEALKTPFTASS